MRLAPRTGRRGAFRAHFGPLRGENGPKRKNGRIWGWAARIGIPRALFWGTTPWVWWFAHALEAPKCL